MEEGRLVQAEGMVCVRIRAMWWEHRGQRGLGVRRGTQALGGTVRSWGFGP